MALPRELKGRAASDGIFCGPVVLLDAPVAMQRTAGAPPQEAEALRLAIAQAQAQIAGMLQDLTGDSADILAFQLAMLEDEALSAAAMEMIAAGSSAGVAWNNALEAQAADCESDADEYFRARAADLRDIRDRVLRRLNGAATADVPSGAVLLGEDMAPTRFLETGWREGGAIALTHGSPTSHVAMLARARGVPMVVGLGGFGPRQPRAAIVDGEAGVVILDPSALDRTGYAKRRAEFAGARAIEARFLMEPARRRDGSRIELLINVASVEELDAIDPASCDGIGLMRSEFLFRDGGALPGEDEQYAAYRQFLEWAGGRPVTIRTLDIGGDKPIAGLTPVGEKNPFLGLRGVRLTLARPGVFRVQLRALARAAVHGALKVMIPMVTRPEELAATAALLDQCIGELAGDGIAHARPPLGIMIEVPAAALAPGLFADAAFFSIGSNDLTQYLTAAARDETAVAALCDPGHPAVIGLIGAVAAFGRAHAIPVSLCGDMASDPAHLPALLAAGLTSLSAAPARLARVKAALAEL